MIAVDIATADAKRRFEVLVVMFSSQGPAIAPDK
jgi:hypothetical protein